MISCFFASSISVPAFLFTFIDISGTSCFQPSADCEFGLYNLWQVPQFASYNFFPSRSASVESELFVALLVLVWVGTVVDEEQLKMTVATKNTIRCFIKGKLSVKFKRKF